ncbi:hypothetical protein ACFC5Z_17205 [Streptomyces sp. NPDC056004]|uniref:hypothetical protein n=1 Tax=Streptomyces sp. NPDC056004 TaxID=3345677 RepID=UPI0035E0B1FE
MPLDGPVRWPPPGQRLPATSSGAPPGADAGRPFAAGTPSNGDAGTVDSLVADGEGDTALPVGVTGGGGGRGTAAGGQQQGQGQQEGRQSATSHRILFRLSS